MKKQSLPGGVAYAFDAETPIAFEQEGVVFRGRRGRIVVDEKAGTTRLVMLDGERIGHGDAQAGECGGPYDLTFYRDKVVGVTEGPARFIHVTMPEGIVQLPAVTIKGVRYAPGTYGSLAIIPLEAGRFEFTLENIPQPPVFPVPSP